MVAVRGVAMSGRVPARATWRLRATSKRPRCCVRRTARPRLPFNALLPLLQRMLSCLSFNAWSLSKPACNACSLSTPAYNASLHCSGQHGLLVLMTCARTVDAGFDGRQRRLQQEPEQERRRAARSHSRCRTRS